MHLFMYSRMKHFSFHEDYRPPYKGTFTKHSKVLNGRNFFEKDHEVFNYDFDYDIYIDIYTYIYMS
jgi:hypothetical protein